MRKIFIASNNQGKIREIKAILGDFYDEFYTPRDMDHPFEVVEDGDTFEANAVKKAVAGRMSFGMDALADDSGLCVDALDGAPGVYSARYSEEGTDEANNKKLLEALERVPVDQRQARFVSAVALAQKGGRLIVVQLCIRDSSITRCISPMCPPPWEWSWYGLAKAWEWRSLRKPAPSTFP